MVLKLGLLAFSNYKQWLHLGNLTDKALYGNKVWQAG